MKNVTLLFNKTKISYSFDRYSDKGWRDCIKYLLSINISEKEIEAFMLSKHMRWAGDHSGGEYGSLNLSTLKKYLEKYPEYSTSEYIKSNLL